MWQALFQEAIKFFFELFNKSKTIMVLIILIIWIASSVVYMPQYFVEWTGLINKIHQNHEDIRLVFLGTSLVLSFIVFPLYVSSKKQRKNLKKHINDTIKTLRYGERVILREFFLQDKDFIYLGYDNPFVLSLIEKGVMETNGIPKLGTFLCNIGSNYKKEITTKVVMIPHAAKLNEFMPTIDGDRAKYIKKYR